MQRKSPNRGRVIVVSGVAAAGKSTVARVLHDRLRWPLLAKDTFKERLFDTFGAADLAASRQLSAASYEIMFDLAHELASVGLDFIMEGNFRWAALREDFARLSEVVEYTQVWCTAPTHVLTVRLQRRASERRHPAHPDSENLSTLLGDAEEAAALPLMGARFALDTSKDDIDATLESVVESLNRAR